MNTRLVNGYNALISRAQAKLDDASLDTKIKTGYRFKIGHYRKALKKLQSLTVNISTIEEAEELEVFTPGEIKHIKSFLEDDALETPQLENPKTREIQLLQTVTGIGPKKADTLYSQGLTLEKLLDGKGNDQLTHHQKMGIKYYHDLNERIPRNEITKMRDFMRKHLQGGFKIMVCGSYRREVTDSGDMDVLVYHPELNDIRDSDYFEMYIEYLTDTGFLVDSLTPNVNRTKYMGMCQLSKRHRVRRIDIRFIPHCSLASAMLYFTGCGEFNKNMRTFAIRKGYKLNEYGIYKTDTDSPSEVNVDVSTEEDIFKVLGLEYIPPDQRLATVKFKK
jgi:DNA polymerase beta